MFKKVICTVLSLAMLMGLSAAAFGETISVTRYEYLAQILADKGVGIAEIESTTFSDVSADQAPVVETGYALGIVSGYQGLFRPNDAVTKDEAVTMRINSNEEYKVKVDELKASLSLEEAKQALADAGIANVADWAVYYVAAGNEISIPSADFYNGYSGSVQISTGGAASEEPIDTPDAAAEQIAAEVPAAAAKPAIAPTDPAAKELFLKANALIEDTSYRYKGSYDIDMTMNYMGETESIHMVMDQEGMMLNPTTAYITTSYTMDGVDMSVEIRMENYEFYTKSVINGEDTGWVMSDASALNADMISSLQDMAGEMEEGISYTFGENREIDGVPYKQVLISYDPAYMSNLTSAAMGLMGTDLTVTDDMTEEEKATMQEMLDSMTMTMDMKSGYFINEETLEIALTVISGTIDMSIMGIDMHMVLNGEANYYDFGAELELPAM